MSTAPGFDGTQLCAQYDGDMFFPENYNNLGKRLQVLRDICSRCHFVEPCLEYALNNSFEGFWGGKTPGERKRINKQRRQAAMN